MRGALTQVRPRPGEDVAQPVYRLANYLDQTGRTDRRGLSAPFWTTVAGTVTDPVLLREFVRHAKRRGRYQRAGHLYAHAAAAGKVQQALADLRGLRKLADQSEAEQLYRQAADLGDIETLRDLTRLARRREQTGDLLVELAALHPSDSGHVPRCPCRPPTGGRHDE